MRVKSRYAPIIVLLLLLFVQVANAQRTDVTDDEVNDIAGELFCPVCENTPLDVCPTQACADWRALIRTQLSEGRTEEEIKDYFADQYGDRVLAEPPQEGFDLIVWLLPIGAVVVGGVFFYRYLHTMQRRRPEPVTEPGAGAAPANGSRPIPVDDYVARIEQEVQND
jgi:cytochrome c-type biogenesis protein CcmH